MIQDGTNTDTICPMYALMTWCEKQAKEEAAEDASLLSQNNKLLSLEGAHYNHVHRWVKSTGNVKKVRKKSLKKQLSLEAFALWGVKPNQHVFLTQVKGTVRKYTEFLTK